MRISEHVWLRLMDPAMSKHVSAGVKRLWVRKSLPFLGDWNKAEDTAHGNLTKE